MAWSLDNKFNINDNEAILAFLRRENPSAHSDIADLLIRSAEGLREFGWYCPDEGLYAYVVLHTSGNRIFGVAFGMSAIAYLLPAEVIPEAVADGGKVYPPLGEGWVLWESNWSLNAKRWCKTAHDYALKER